MPTPIRSFLDVATRYGNVDPNDPAAVQRWFTRVLPNLPRETVEEIFELLLENEVERRRGAYGQLSAGCTTAVVVLESAGAHSALRFRVKRASAQVEAT